MLERGQRGSAQGRGNSRSKRTAKSTASTPKVQRLKRRHYDHEILLLQGGGALGSFHAGVYEGLAEAGMVPTWVVGISIGAINSAIIVGNPPERRVERLRQFWHRVSSYAPLPLPWLFDPIRPLLDRLSFLSGATCGIPGFFTPRFPNLATRSHP